MAIQKDYVWYVAYGSNMNMERFLYYIKGGFYPLIGQSYTGCTDKSDPVDSWPFKIPFERYFGLSYTRWGQGGVAFIDPQVKGSTLGRAYLVTRQQYEEIKRQEGPQYNVDIDLGLFHGNSAMTITSNHRVSGLHKPSNLYRFVFDQGVEQTHDLERIKGNSGAMF